MAARPNFMKIAPLVRFYQNSQEMNDLFEIVLVHTGQHYDDTMSNSFLHDLEMPTPNYNLEAHGVGLVNLVSNVLVEFEKVCKKEEPDLVLTVGDVSSTLACSIVTKYLKIPLCHIEAGLRSNNRNMPEEINRLMTDSVTDLFFTTSSGANTQLMKEGIPENQIFFVGNLMIDSLDYFYKKNPTSIRVQETFLNKKFALLTLHRPNNVDSKKSLEHYLHGLREVSKKIPIYFPCHPRTKSKIEEFKLTKYFDDKNFVIGEPANYLDMIALYEKAALVLTDSGGIQEETTFLSIPCLTLREDTERPVTVDQGTNIIVGSDFEKISLHVDQVLSDTFKKGQAIQFWDGKAAERIWNVLAKNL